MSTPTKLPLMDVADLRQIAFIARRIAGHAQRSAQGSYYLVSGSDIEALREQFDGAGVPYNEQDG